MGNLVLNGATSGSTTLQPTDATTQTITLPANSGTVITTQSSGKVIPASALPAGTVIQAVNVVNTTAYSYSMTANVWQTTSLTATITPTSSTNKILILWSIPWQVLYSAGANSPTSIRIISNGTNALTTAKFGLHTAPTNGENQTNNDFVTYLDAPGTTSAVTYTIQIINPTSGTTTYINQSYANSGLNSVCTLLEIAA